MEGFTVLNLILITNSFIMKKLFVLMCVALFAGTASAQITWNMKGGAGIAHCYGWDAGDLSSHFVGKIGAGIEKPFTSNWSLMPSLEMAWKGAKYVGAVEVGDNHGNVMSYDAYCHLNLFYLQVPVLAAYRLNLADKWNMTLKAGPYFAYAILGQLDDPVDGKFNVFGSDANGKRLDIGLDFGIDFEYQRYVFGLEYELGFLSMVDGGELKNGAFYVTVGYKF